MAQHCLYLMISRTDTTVGSIIRCFTGYDYNHVSLTLDPSFGQWVSFARYAKNVPLAGGFIREDPDRFFSGGNTMPVRIFQIDISENRYRQLQNLFARAGSRDCGLLYNTYGALASGLRFSFHVAGAYTCLEFANAVLEEDHRSIRALNAHLEPHLIFEGDLHDLITAPGHQEGDYFRRRSLPAAIAETTVHFFRLTRSTVSPHRYDPVSAGLRLP